MSIFDPTPSRWAPRVLGIFRIAMGLFFITFGTMKLFGWPPLPPGTEIPVMSQAWIGGLMEIVGGALIALGLFTRPVAFILSGEMAVAYFQFHAPNSPFPQINQGIPAIVFCWFFFYLVFSGAGEWSLDAMIARKRGERVAW